MSPEEHTADLLASGYKEIAEHKSLRVGQRVRHHGHQWTKAIDHGTAVIERLFISPRIIHGSEDVELIAKLDNPTGWGSGFGYWADYHTVPVEGQ